LPILTFLFSTHNYQEKLKKIYLCRLATDWQLEG